MPKVQNNSKKVQGLCALGVLEKTNETSRRDIDQVDIAPGEAKDIEDRFLEPPGAKELLESGVLSIVSSEAADPKSEDADPKSETTEPKGKGKGKGGAE